MEVTSDIEYNICSIYDFDIYDNRKLKDHCDYDRISKLFNLSNVFYDEEICNIKMVYVEISFSNNTVYVTCMINMDNDNTFVLLESDELNDYQLYNRILNNNDIRYKIINQLIKSGKLKNIIEN